MRRGAKTTWRNMSIISSSVFTLIDQIAAAETIAGVMEPYLAAAAEVGLPYAASSFYPPAPTALPNLIVDAMPPGWLQGYYDHNLFEGDLLTARARASFHAFEWKMQDWDLLQMTPAQQRSLKIPKSVSRSNPVSRLRRLMRHSPA